MLARFEWYLFPLSQPKKILSVLQSWTGPPLTKLSGSAHDKNHYIDNPMQNRQALTRGYIMLNTYMYLERVRV